METLKEKLLGNLELSLRKLEAEPGDQYNIASSTDEIEKSLTPIKDEARDDICLYFLLLILSCSYL